MDDLSPEQIAQWKTQYGLVFQTSYKKQDFVFRAITLREFESVFADGLNSAESEDEVLRVATLYPDVPNFDGLPAGIVSKLAVEVLGVSGFQNPKKAKKQLEDRRTESEDVFTLMKAMILATMPTYKEEELNELTFSQLIRKVVLAEKIIEVHQAIMGGEPVKLVLVDPEEEAEEEELAKVKHAVQKPTGTATYDDPIAQRLRHAFG